MNHAQSFIDEMANAGLVPSHVIGDGGLHRFGKNKNSWYVLHQTATVTYGAFGDWATGIQGSWYSGKDVESDPIAQAAVEAIIATAKAKRDLEAQVLAKSAADTCQRIWDKALPANDDNPYLAAKGVKSHGLRVGAGPSSFTGDVLIIPLTDGRKLTTLQYIGTIEGKTEKRFHAKGKKSGGYFIIGEIVDSLVIAEGYATGATIHEATGLPVVIAFDSTLTPPSNTFLGKPHGARLSAMWPKRVCI